MSLEPSCQSSNLPHSSKLTLYERAAPVATGKHTLIHVNSNYTSVLKAIIVKKLNSLKHLVRTTVAESHN